MKWREVALVLCPKCDREHLVSLKDDVCRCKCGEEFPIFFRDKHSEEFVANPDTSPRF